VRLFCFPYAGGSASVYRGWPAQVGTDIEVCAVQLPGRYSRVKEPPFRAVGELVPAIAAELAGHLDKPFAFFGHSMGALIAFELARHLRRTRRLEPVHLFVSGHRAPQLPNKRRPTYDLNDVEFIAELRRLQGTPQELLDDAGLMQLAMPLLRADFELSERYDYRPEAPLGCPITAFGGTRDLDIGDAVAAWREQTSGRFALHMIEGDHFFINAATKNVIEQVMPALSAPGRASALPGGVIGRVDHG
jgi:medium-chain acyl-[acyl-carrier-protein] hydrolase